MSEPESAPGAPPNPPRRPAAPPLDPQVAAFGFALRALTPRGFVTEALVAINVLVFAIMVLRGVGVMSPAIKDLLAWGANYGPRTSAGESWRLFTATFLHFGIVHLFMNMYVLWDVGRLMERVLGNAGFFVLYLASGLAGSIASVLTNPYVVSAGASGAVFGVYGALIGFLVRERSSIPGPVLQKLRSSALFFVVVNTAYGASVEGIDVAAHFGGLAAGFLGGLVLAHPLTPEGASKRWTRAFVFAAVAALSLGIGARSLPQRPDVQAELETFAEVEKRSLAEFNKAIEEAKDEKLDDIALADRIETKVIPEWSASRKKLASFTHLPKKQAKIVDSLVRYATAREDGFRLLAEGARKDDKNLVEQANQKQAEAERLIKEIGGDDQKK
jgi:rhomboid protease GluP